MLETDFTVDIEEARGVAVEPQEIKAKPKPKAKRKINPIDLAKAQMEAIRLQKGRESAAQLSGSMASKTGFPAFSGFERDENS